MEESAELERAWSRGDDRLEIAPLGRTFRTPQPGDLATDRHEVRALSLGGQDDVDGVSVLSALHGNVQLTGRSRPDRLAGLEETPRQAQVHQLDRDLPNQKPLHLEVRITPG